MSSTRSLQRDRSGRLYLWFAAIALAVAFAGFAKTYYLRSFFPSPPLSSLLQVHGLVLTLWLVLFFVQVALIAAHRTDLHRRLGKIGAVLAVFVVVLSVAAIMMAAHRDFVSPGDPKGALPIFADQLGIVLIFAVCVGGALIFRRQREIHKRLMVLALLRILTNAILRLPLQIVQRGGIPIVVALDTALVVGFVVADTIRNRRLNPVFGWGGMLLVVSDPLLVLFSQTNAWKHIATWLLA